jgi:hypothetical protein
LRTGINRWRERMNITVIGRGNAGGGLASHYAKPGQL